ncbi:MAG: cytochrome c biogenesis protein CcsA [Actinobacteria bacterium]|nr:cytochrome c biogenesis protein CcsA [Actinomycetota bacterium]
MASLGSVLLALAFAAAATAGLIALIWRHDERKLVLSRRIVYGFCFLVTACIAIIEFEFLSDNFAFKIVQEHSSLETPTFYKVAAMWSSQEGSLLLWAWVLSIFSSAALYFTRNKLRQLVPWATGVMMGIATFFTGLMLFAPDVNPFSQLNPVPSDGIGLNPLLQHPSMMIHPPMLYSGYVALTIPFAFAIGALITRRVDAEWIRATRKFALIAWTFLGFGLLLGARWSYTELGWGGYWAWDPVENAALMPWLLCTAFLHSIMVQEKRGMLKVWNASLVVGTFSMALLGTFLVRSGVLQSIHAFGNNTVGPYILALIGVVVIGSTALIISRLDELRTPKRIDSLISREAVFLVNNLLLVGLVLVIAWGTFFPLISELFTGNKSSLAAPWFDRYTTPLAILLVLFTGIGPLLGWRRVSWKTARRAFRIPVAAMVVVTLALALFTDAGSRPWALALFAFATFAIVGIGQEFWNGAAGRKRLTGEPMGKALLGIVTRNRRRYGGYIVHVGVAVLLIGIAASSSFQTNQNVELKPGESTVVDGRTVTYVRPTSKVDGLAFTAGAIVDVQEGSKTYRLETTRRFYRPTGRGGVGGIGDYFGGEADSTIGLWAGPVRDIWVAVQPNIVGIERKARIAEQGFQTCVEAGPGTPPQCKDVRAMMIAARDNPALQPEALKQIERLQELTAKRIARGYLTENATATFKVIINPLVLWMWIGGLIALAGALIAIWPSRGRRKGALVRTETDALKEAKYREIRDAELDHAAGKLSDEDYAILDAELRKEAVEMLDELERSREGARVGAGAGANGGNGNGVGNGNGNGAVTEHANGNGSSAAEVNGNGHHGNGNGNGHDPAAEPEKAERS